jgi:NCS1 family nucleobase:cation symporter-1
MHRLQYLFWGEDIACAPNCYCNGNLGHAKAGGAGEFFNAPPTVHGSTRAWLWLANLTSVTGGFSTLAVNIPDFSRFSKNSGAQLWQLPCIPFFKVIVGIFGIISASASKSIYGTTLWSPLTIIAKWQGTPGGKAAAFFAGLVWLVAQVSVNVTANSISFANGQCTKIYPLLNTKFS